MSNKLSNFVTARWKTARGERREAYYYRAPRSQGRKMTPLGSDYAEALRRYAEIVGARLATPEPETLAAVAAEYFTWADNRTVSKLSPRTIRDRRTYWRHLDPVFGHLPIDSLEPGWMFEYFEARSSQISAKKELKFLSTLCSWARARGKMRAANPCSGIMTQLEVNESREIYVEDPWYDLVYECGNQLVRDAMEFTYRFANRPAETALAKFQDIDGDELVIALQKTKGKGLKQKRVPLDGPRLDYVTRQRARNPRSLYLVSDESGQPLKPNAAKFRKAWKEARDAAEKKAKKEGIPFTRFQLRDIRAKAATDIARDHGIEAARLMLGHTTQKQTAAYIRSVRGAAKIALGTASG